MAEIKGIIFDLDDTLYDCTDSLQEAARHRAAQAMVKAGLPLTLEEAHQLQVSLMEQHGPLPSVCTNRRDVRPGR